ncbi:hypothetical protein D3C78_1464820 [compost metagenome]
MWLAAEPTIAAQDGSDLDAGDGLACRLAERQCLQHDGAFVGATIKYLIDLLGDYQLAFAAQWAMQSQGFLGMNDLLPGYAGAWIHLPELAVGQGHGGHRQYP